MNQIVYILKYYKILYSEGNILNLSGEIIYQILLSKNHSILFNSKLQIITIFGEGIITNKRNLNIFLSQALKCKYRL